MWRPRGPFETVAPSAEIQAPWLARCQPSDWPSPRISSTLSFNSGGGRATRELREGPHHNIQSSARHTVQNQPSKSPQD
eukprot:15485043-Alexandrium_andersonii.AAC.1